MTNGDEQTPKLAFLLVDEVDSGEKHQKHGFFGAVGGNQAVAAAVKKVTKRSKSHQRDSRHGDKSGLSQRKSPGGSLIQSIHPTPILKKVQPVTQQTSEVSDLDNFPSPLKRNRSPAFNGEVP